MRVWRLFSYNWSDRSGYASDINFDHIMSGRVFGVANYE